MQMSFGRLSFTMNTNLNTTTTDPDNHVKETHDARVEDVDVGHAHPSGDHKHQSDAEKVDAVVNDEDTIDEGPQHWTLKTMMAVVCLGLTFVGKAASRSFQTSLI